MHNGRAVQCAKPCHALPDYVTLSLPPPPHFALSPLCPTPVQAAPSGYFKEGGQGGEGGHSFSAVKVREGGTSGGGPVEVAADPGAAAFERHYGKLTATEVIWSSRMGAIKIVNHDEERLKVVGLSYVATSTVKGGLSAIFRAKYDFDKKLDKNNAYWYISKSHYGTMIAMDGEGRFVKEHLKTLGEISDAKHHKLELKREREDREGDRAEGDRAEGDRGAGAAGAMSDSSGDSPQRSLQLMVGVHKDKAMELYLSAHAGNAFSKTDKYDECIVIPLAVGGEAYCLKLDEEMPGKALKRAKTGPATSEGELACAKESKPLVHMLFASYHKDAVPVMWNGVYSSMEEAKKEVERREFNCYSIETVELDSKAFSSRADVRESQ